MSRRDPTLAFRHMLDHARETLELMRGRSRADLDDDRSLQLQVERLLEIVGELASADEATAALVMVSGLVG